ncbi:hypothetical protein BDK51DRAFT_33337, partial [Blyttiomyces helicus]
MSPLLPVPVPSLLGVCLISERASNEEHFSRLNLKLNRVSTSSGTPLSVLNFPHSVPLLITSAMSASRRHRLVPTSSSSSSSSSSASASPPDSPTMRTRRQPFAAAFRRSQRGCCGVSKLWVLVALLGAASLAIFAGNSFMLLYRFEREGAGLAKNGMLGETVRGLQSRVAELEEALKLKDRLLFACEEKLTKPPQRSSLNATEPLVLAKPPSSSSASALNAAVVTPAPPSVAGAAANLPLPAPQSATSPAAPSLPVAPQAPPSAADGNRNELSQSSKVSTGNGTLAARELVSSGLEQQKRADDEELHQKQSDDMLRLSAESSGEAVEETGTGSKKEEAAAAVKKKEEAPKKGAKSMKKSPIKAAVDHSKHKHAQKKGENDLDPKDNSPVKTWKMLPSSSAWCYGDNRANRICRFRNVCFHPREEAWFILQTNRTVQQNIPLHRDRRALLELGTIKDHHFFFWNFVEVSPFDPRFRNIRVRYEETPHFMFSRLHPRNIMHNLHDDVNGLYFLLK